MDPPEVVNVILPVVKEVAPDGLGSGKQIQERLELIKVGYFNKIKKGSVKQVGKDTMWESRTCLHLKKLSNGWQCKYFFLGNPIPSSMQPSSTPFYIQQHAHTPRTF